MKNYVYDDTIDRLRKLGFTANFGLNDNCLTHTSGNINADAFIIVDIYRYKKGHDTVDEKAVYAIESYSKIKGILISPCRLSSDLFSDELINKLRLG